jgi:broad-specificity NMP kinase
MGELEPTIFHLIGTPGVGKYTVAKELVALTGARLVDNHAVANVIFNLLDQDGIKPLPLEVWPHVGAVRRAVLDALIDVSPRHLSFVFTNYLRGEDEAEMAMFQEMAAVAEVRRSRFVPVLLSCATEELVRRVPNQDRKQRMKLVDPVEARRMNDEVPRFQTDHPNAISLDTTHTPPAVVARRVVEWAESLG